MYPINEVLKCYLLLIYSCFVWTHLLRSKPIIKTHLLYSSCRCEDLIRVYLCSKKILMNDWENIAYWKEYDWSEALLNRCQQWWNLAAVQPQESMYSRYSHLSLETVLPALTGYLHYKNYFCSKVALDV